MKIAITGATGYIGRNTIRTAAENGHEVIALARRQCNEIGRYARQSSISDPAAALQGIDVVIHLAGLAHVHRVGRQVTETFDTVNRELALNIASAARLAGVKRFIYVSSLGVHGNWSVEPIHEYSPFSPHTPYALSKLTAERELAIRLASTETRLIIVRPPMVYGPRCPGNFRRLLGLVRRGVPLPLATAAARRSFVYVGNLSDFLLHAGTWAGEADVFVIGDGSDFTARELIENIAKGARVKARLFPFPLPLLRAAGRWFGMENELNSITRPMLVNWTRAHDALRWKPPFDAERSIKDSAISTPTDA